MLQKILQRDKDEGDVERDCWGALLAAQTLLENERERLGQVSGRNAAKLERIRQWLLFIVSNGLLPPVDRAMAGEALSVFGDDRDFEELVPVPASPFLMGDNEISDAKPQHEVTLPGFKIGRYPITNAQYRDFVEATKREWGSYDGLRPERSNCPAGILTWHDAIAFCDWLTTEWRKKGKISSNETVRLPTEAEWEKAARGLEGRVYPWGDDWEQGRCNSSESKIGGPCAVGMFPTGASPYGCLDMAGNVWEWTSSLWGKDFDVPGFKYPYKSNDGRENLKAGKKILRVLRGGSWFNDQGDARCYYRDCDDPYLTFYSIGFRVVVSLVSCSSAL